MKKDLDLDEDGEIPLVPSFPAFSPTVQLENEKNKNKNKKKGSPQRKQKGADKVPPLSLSPMRKKNTAPVKEKGFLSPQKQKSPKKPMSPKSTTRTKKDTPKSAKVRRESPKKDTVRSNSKAKTPGRLKE